ncbi:hypothetical protein HDU96_008688 [Phlyctochytrium bullatum]|nr:hypothetical protein HDU96_008688 [Phlyctochytrium bullatum]
MDYESDDMVLSEIKDVITGLIKHDAPERPSKWIDLCKSIVAKGGASSSNLQLNVDSSDNPPVEDDDEALSRTAPPKPSPERGSQAQSSVVLIPRWRTQVFVIQCLRKIVLLLSTTNVAEHIDLIAARGKLGDGKPHDFLVFRLTDLIKIAFSCATATVDELRLEGLNLLNDILEVFSSSRDPDFAESALLEQYQAQISAALTPAFSEEASPLIQASACRVCAAILFELLVVIEKTIQSPEARAQLEAINILKSVVTLYGDAILENDHTEERSQQNGQLAEPSGASSSSLFLVLWKALMNSFMYHLPALSSNPVTTYYLLKASETERSRLIQALLDTQNSVLRLKLLNDSEKELIHPQALIILIEVLEEYSTAAEVVNGVIQNLLSFFEAYSNSKGNEKIIKTFQSFVLGILDRTQLLIEERDFTSGALRSYILVLAASVSSVSPLFNKELSQRAACIIGDLLTVGDRCPEHAIAASRIIFNKPGAITSNISHTYLFRELIPQIFAFSVDKANQMEEDVFQELLRLFASLAFELPAGFVGAVIKIFTLMVKDNVENAKKIRSVAATLFQIASRRQAEFRDELIKLPQETRTTIETLLKSLVAPSSDAQSTEQELDAESAQPKIKLKTFF